MILLTISLGKILFGLVCCVIAMTIIKGGSKCDHIWRLTNTSRILRRHGERALTTYTYRCDKCGHTKTTVS